MSFACPGFKLPVPEGGVQLSAQYVCELCDYEALALYYRTKDCERIVLPDLEDMSVFNIESIAFVDMKTWNKFYTRVESLLVVTEASAMQFGYGYFGRVGNMYLFTDEFELPRNRFIHGSNYYIKFGEHS